TAYFSALCLGATAAQQGDGQREWLRSMAADADNVRAALSALVADDPATAQLVTGSLGWFWWLSGRAIEGSRWLAAARAAGGDVSALVRARMSAWSVYLGTADSNVGTPEAQELDRIVDDALDLYRQAGVPAEMAEMS